MKRTVRNTILFITLALWLHPKNVAGQSNSCSSFLYQKDTLICPNTAVTLSLIPAPATDSVLPGVWKQLIAKSSIDSVLFNIKAFGYDRVNQYLYSIIHQKIIRFDVKNNTVSTVNASNWPGDYTEFTYDHTNNRLLYWRGGRDSVFALPAAGGSWSLIGTGAIDRDAYGSSAFWNPVSQHPGFYGGYGYNQMKSWIYESNTNGWVLKKPNPTIDSVPAKGGDLVAANADGSKLYLFAGQGSYTGNELDGSCALGSPWASASGLYCWLKDLWELDLNNYSFKNILPVNNSSIQYQGAVAYDYDKARFFLFGGFQPTGNYLQNQNLPNTNKTFRFRTGKDAGFVEFTGQAAQPPAAIGNGLNGLAYYDPKDKRVLWARYDGIWAYYPDSTNVSLSQKSYMWSTGDTTSTITVQPSQTTKYGIQRISGGLTCADSIVISVSNMQTNLQQTVTVCADSAKLDAGKGFQTYLWNTGDTSQSISVQKNGTYYITVSKGACTSKDSSQVQLASAVLDFIVRPQKDSICVGESDTLNVVAPQSGVAYSWYLPGSSIKINSGTFYGLNSVTKNVSYIINATSIPAACPAKSTSAQITIRQKIAKPVLAIDSLGATAVIFSWNAISDATGYLISLNNGLDFQNPSNGSMALKELVPNIPAGQSQKIIIKALGLAACQTSDTSQLVATTINPFGNGIYTPNAFTPNGDGVNDVFKIYGTAIKTMRLKIYNQWGEMIFSSTDLAVGWDGNSKGNKSAASVYHFTLEATMQDGTDVVKSGVFTLIR